MNRSCLHRRLRYGTQDVHAALERGLSVSSSRGAYLLYLQCMLAFHGPLECRLQRSPRFHAFLPDAAQRIRMPALRADLRALGVAATKTSMPELPAVDTLPELAGVSYVLEGSTLGGQVLARTLQHELQLSPDVLQYVSGYGKDTGARFKYFLERLGALDLSQHESEIVVASARETFTLLRRFLQDTLSH